MTHYFFSGIGGSGMLPLAQILKNQGHRISGSDRAHDQGRSPEKYEALTRSGITLFPQDGSGPYGADEDVPDMASPVCMLGELSARPDYVVISAAVESDTPDVLAAKKLGIPILKRAELLTKIFNTYPHRIAVGGTSGKTTTTGMIGFLLNEAGLAPVVMNGGILKNYGTSALSGNGNIFVTESDESDGSIAFYNPEVAVLNNISIDHKSLDELRALFKDFVDKSAYPVINADNEEAMAMAAANATTYSVQGQASYVATAITHTEHGLSATIHHNGENAHLTLNVPGLHNLSNALAAIAAVAPYGVSLKQACALLPNFSGIKRRMELVGEKSGITVMDDFAHNPDKIAASLSALNAGREGRLLVIFQMHGYGPLKLMWQELADTFSKHLKPDDHVFMMPPLYLGGTADQSVGTQQVAERIGPRASWHETRDAAANIALSMAKDGDRIVIMGARDDTLSQFALTILDNLT